MHSSNTDAAATRTKRKRRRSTHKTGDIADPQQSRRHTSHETNSNLLHSPSSPPRKKQKTQDCKILAIDASSSCLLEAKEEKGGCNTTETTQLLSSAFSKSSLHPFSFMTRDLSTLEKEQGGGLETPLLNPTKTPLVHCLFPCPSPRLWDSSPPPSPSSSLPSPLSPFLLMPNTQAVSLAQTTSSPCSSIEPFFQSADGCNPFSSHSSSLFHMPVSSKSPVLRFSNPLDMLNEYKDSSDDDKSGDNDDGDDDSYNKKENDDKSDAGVQDDDNHAFRELEGSHTYAKNDNVEMDSSQMEMETRKKSPSPPNTLHLLYQVGRAVECFLSPFYQKIYQAFTRHQKKINTNG